MLTSTAMASVGRRRQEARTHQEVFFFRKTLFKMSKGRIDQSQVDFAKLMRKTFHDDVVNGQVEPNTASFYPFNQLMRHGRLTEE